MKKAYFLYSYMKIDYFLNLNTNRVTAFSNLFLHVPAKAKMPQSKDEGGMPSIGHTFAVSPKKRTKH